MSKLTLQKNLSSFPFERTVDWRVKFPDLLNSGNFKSNYFPTNELYAKSVSFNPTFIEVQEDRGLPGYYQSKPVIPKLSMELYIDSSGYIENALQQWLNSAFDYETGHMPTTGNAIQRIIVDRIYPINMRDVILGWHTSLGKTEFKPIVKESYVFTGYLSNLPEYHGNQNAAIRTIPLNIKLLSAEKK